MTTPDTFWDIPADREPERGPGGSPMLIPRGLESSGVRAPYTRASYMADQIENKDHIHRWEMRYLCKAMGQNEDLAALAAVERYSTGVSDPTVGREKSASGRNLDRIIERALDRVRIHEKADRGTAIHGSTEPGAPAGVDRFLPVSEAFRQVNRRECIEIVATEVFTANDEIMAAGTFDHLVKVAGHPLLKGFVVADKKTGSFDPLSWCIQIATYANGEPYNLDTDGRPGWPGWVNLEYGLVWQIDAVSAEVKLWVIDIALGWRLAKIAADIRDIDVRSIAAEYKSPTFDQRLAGSTTRDDLKLLWHAYGDDQAAQALIEEKARSL